MPVIEKVPFTNKSCSFRTYKNPTKSHLQRRHDFSIQSKFHSNELKRIGQIKNYETSQ